MPQEISLLPDDFVPTTSFSGSEPPSVIRGSNVVIRSVLGRTRIENYPGSKDLSENYNVASDTLTGTLAWTAGSPTVTGTTTVFETQLHIGQPIFAATEVFFVRRIVSDTSFIADRAPDTTASGQTARYLPSGFFEIGKKRGVLRRGNALEKDRKDIYFAGEGLLYLNGTSTTFSATRRPRRLQRSSAGAYTEFPIGFDKAPPSPTSITATTGGHKGMQAGKYSFMISYWNSVTDGFSNPCEIIKKDAGGGGTDLTIAASGRFIFDFTRSLAGMPTNADGFIIWGSSSGGGVTEVNTSLFNNGAWLRWKKIRTTAYSVGDADVDTGADTITIPGHKFQTADSVFTATTWGGLTGGTEYFAIVVDRNTIQLATSAVNAKAGTAIDINADPGGTVSIRSLDANDVTYIECLDGEMGAVASGTNDPPEDCEFLAEFANQIVYLSSLGKTTATKPFGTSPGNYALIEKAGNREAAPTDWRVSVGDEITGFAVGAGRLFCLTPNSVPFITPTGRTELARLSGSGQLDMPFSSRPFWTKGSINPYGICIIQGDVFVYSGRMVLRSPSSADSNVTPFEIGLPVSDLTKDWYEGHVHLVHCPKNQQLLVISSATHRNTAGYWVSQILPYSLQKNRWEPVITLTSDTRDMIVSGAATVGGRAEFLAGGRVSGGTYSVGTFRYDETASAAVSYYLVIQPSDLGEERKQKYIKGYRITGRTTSGILQVHGARAGGDYDLADMAAGSNSLSGNITVANSTDITHKRWIKHFTKRLQNFSIRFAGEWAGTGEVDSIHEFAALVGYHGMNE